MIGIKTAGFALIISRVQVACIFLSTENKFPPVYKFSSAREKKQFLPYVIFHACGTPCFRLLFWDEKRHLASPCAPR